jgi:hypothetical protein
MKVKCNIGYLTNILTWGILLLLLNTIWAQETKSANARQVRLYTTAQSKEIVVKNLDEEKSIAKPENKNQAISDNLTKNAEAVKKLRQIIDEKYSYRNLRSVNWDSLFKQYGPRMENAKTVNEFAEAAAQMLSQAKDMHLWVKVNGQAVEGFKRKIFRNYNLNLLGKIIPSWRQYNDRVCSGRIDKNIGYILIKSWASEKPETLEAAFDALKQFSDCQGFIIDVRPNAGGSETLAEKFAGCFVNAPAVYAKHIFRDIDDPKGWSKMHERILSPNPDRPPYRGRVAVLMGHANLSSCEAFILMMKQVPDCVLVGGKSYGSSGNPKPYDLGNGVEVWIPSWKALRPDGTCF